MTFGLATIFYFENLQFQFVGEKLKAIELLILLASAEAYGEIAFLACYE